MSFNDYLKYVKGHAKETSLAYGYADRLCTAIRRVVAERLGDSYFELTDRLTPSYSEIEADDYVMIEYENYDKKVKIVADLEDCEIKISSKINTNVMDDLGLSVYDDYSVSNKRKISYNLYELLRFASTHYGRIATENDLNDELVNYIVNGKDTIGEENIIINVMVIYTIKALESIDFFYTSDIDEDDDDARDEEFRRKIMEMAAEGYDDEEDIPEEYRSSEPGPAAHPDDGNTKADESAESGI